MKIVKIWRGICLCRQHTAFPMKARTTASYSAPLQFSAFVSVLSELVLCCPVQVVNSGKG